MKRITLLLGLTALLAAASASAQTSTPLPDTTQLAFPSAEGWGRHAAGGRGGRVIKVTNLNDSGEGSLRWAVEQRGARIVTFDVDGTIELKSPLRITHDSITIAGQSAPGAGICLKDHPLSVSASHVVIRYLRVRPGAASGRDVDGLSGGRYGQHDVILDHLSVSWSVDECLSFYKTERLTVGWCLVSHSLSRSVHTKGRHGFGGIWGGDHATFHHNLLANHTSRNPRFSSVEGTRWVDYRNNVVYNFGYKAAYGGGRGGQINFVANYYKPGPATSARRFLEVAADSTSRYYIAGNVMEGDPALTADNRLGVYDPAGTGLVATPFPSLPIDEQDATEAYRRVIHGAGCSRERDAYDTEVLLQTALGLATMGEQGIIDTPEQAGGWPPLRRALPPTDSDGDAMPDAWETAHGLNPHDPADATRTSLHPYYTNVEIYLNALVGE